MKAGDLQSLFQLAVALNLGFGALFAFSEPTREKIKILLSNIEESIISASEQLIVTDAQTDTLFLVIRDYQIIYKELSIFNDANIFYNGIIIRFVFVISALISFIGLIFTSMLSSSDTSEVFTVFPILLNAPALVFGSAKCLELIGLSSKIEPQLISQIERINKAFNPAFTRSKTLSSLH